MLAVVNVPNLLITTSIALRHGAIEIEQESIRTPQNLLAAYQRLSVHVEYFLRVSSACEQELRGSDAAQRHVADLRERSAIALEKIGTTLRCGNGYLERKALPAEGDYAAILATAGLLARELAGDFESTGKILLI